jgi:hypothetical protein
MDKKIEVLLINGLCIFKTSKAGTELYTMVLYLKPLGSWCERAAVVFI